MMCEKCWADASRLALMRGSSVADEYERLVAERKDLPCSPKDQAGIWWDYVTEKDIRQPAGAAP